MSATLDDIAARLDRIEVALGGILQRLDGAARPAQAPVPASTVDPGPEATWPTVFPPYGRSKGQPIAGAGAGDLDYYANGARRSLADPSKARWHGKEAALLAAIEREKRNQNTAPAGLGGGSWDSPPPGEPPPGFGSPPPDDDGIPFVTSSETR